MGWGVYQCDHEDANGQFEVNFDYADALTTSDRIVFFKMATSQIAKKYGAIASHMPKPFADRTGSGLHAHYHLADAESGAKIFLDEGDKRGLGCSELAYHFLGGILHHARALCAVSSPTVNCYKRLQLGAGIYSSRSGFTWTPAFITYGDNNRTQMIRTAGEGHFEDRTISSCGQSLFGAGRLSGRRDSTALSAAWSRASQIWAICTSAPSTRSKRQGYRFCRSRWPRRSTHWARTKWCRARWAPSPTNSSR